MRAISEAEAELAQAGSRAGERDLPESPDHPPQAANGVTLHRSLGLSLLVLYGVGTTIGAGIYVLLGEVARIAGPFTPLSFLGAGLLAACTAGSFAELSARYPRSAGQALYVREAFGSRLLGTGVGLMVVAAGVVSCATISTGFAGYLGELWGAPRVPTLLALSLALTAVAAWGVRESVRLAGAITLLEILGLLLVLWVTRGSWELLPERLPEFVPPLELDHWLPIGSAAVLAFYAFLGFEDMVNVAEEVKDVRRTLPLAIGITLVVTTLLYLLVASAAVLTVPPSELAESGAPLVRLYERAGGQTPEIVGIIAIIAVMNGALIQIIMASRVLYGLGCQGALPTWFSRVHPYTRTPVYATLFVGGLALLLSSLFPLIRLAEATSLIALVVFALVNLSLARLHQRAPAPPGILRVPRWIPVAGAAVSLGALGLRLAEGIG